MHFIIDEDINLIIGWSAKCGCSHIKKISWYLKTENMDHAIHLDEEHSDLPDDIKKYNVIIITRNPYERLVSGFLDKYRKNSDIRRDMWNNDNITFRDFVNELLNRNWNRIDYHHFVPQTEERFELEKIVQAKSIKIYDISKIDYEYIEQLYNKKIPNSLLNFRGGHHRIPKLEWVDTHVHDLEMDVYYDCNVHVKYFYDEDLKQKVYEFYENDFLFFKDLNYEREFDHFEIPESLIPKFERTIYEFKSMTVNEEFSSYCILIVPNTLNIYNFSKTIESIKGRQLCDIYILVDQLYYNKYLPFFTDTNVYLINTGRDIYNCNILEDSCVEKYLKMYKSRYETVILYNDLPIFVSDLSQKAFNPIGQFEKIDINNSKWYFKSELEKDIESFGYSDYYLLNYNGIVLKSNVFLEIFNTIKEISYLKKGKYPILELLIPTVLKNNKVDYDNIYSADETLWSIDHEKLNYEVLTKTYKY
jgi:hypothetical protein